MNPDEWKWVEAALSLAKQATERGVNVVLYQNGESEVLITNVTDPAAAEPSQEFGGGDSGGGGASSDWSDGGTGNTDA